MRVAVIGGGIVGVAVARRITQVDPAAEIVLYEKEDRLAQHQSGHNSGVLHAGVYYQPGSLKSVLCRRGVGLLREFVRDRGVGLLDCGKVIVATTRREEERLVELERRARANGVPGIERLGPAGLADVEPEVVGRAGLWSPSTSVIDFPAVVDCLTADFTDAGGTVRLGRQVTAISVGSSRVSVVSQRTADPAEMDEQSFDTVLTCAGLQSDRVARMAGAPDDVRIVPFRGQYLRLRPGAQHLVKGLIYPVPDPRYPFLGVHLTRQLDGEVLVGPNAVLAWGREAYRGAKPPSASRARGRQGLRDLAAMASWPGLWRMAAQHWRTGLREIVGSVSRARFLADARRYVPQLGPDDIEAGPEGIRAQAVDRRGGLLDDFAISVVGRVVAVRNAPSPGATSSLAIAEHVVEQARSARLIGGRPSTRLESDT